MTNELQKECIYLDIIKIIEVNQEIEINAGASYHKQTMLETIAAMDGCYMIL